MSYMKLNGQIANEPEHINIALESLKTSKLAEYNIQELNEQMNELAIRCNCWTGRIEHWAESVLSSFYVWCIVVQA